MPGAVPIAGSAFSSDNLYVASNFSQLLFFFHTVIRDFKWINEFTYRSVTAKASKRTLRRTRFTWPMIANRVM